ncbi:RNA-binding domain-containing protein [Chromobacterium sp. TRC.1.1.SA]|uniref:RNA-binding domain-containing protein n=1 Tax=Chromobacterium indicum TaxID=3110228 RepID=A0ABV0CDZ8_9NEIS
MNNLIAKLHQCVLNGMLDLSVFDGEANFREQLIECEVLDFKQQAPESDSEYAKTIRDLIAFHNSYGGFLVFGVCEIKKDREFEVVGVPENSIDISKLRDMAHEYANAELRINLSSATWHEKNIEIIYIAKRTPGAPPTKLKKNGPDEKPRKPCFKKDEVVFRRIQSNSIANHADEFEFLYSDRTPPSLDLNNFGFDKREPLENNLPDRSLICTHLIGRRDDLSNLWAWLSDDFSRVRLIAGEGGQGKTSLAYHFAMQVASNRIKPFERVVWLSAKKRQFLALSDSYRENHYIDFDNASTLFSSIALEHGAIDADLIDLSLHELLQTALTCCSTFPSFIIIDDIDSLTPDDQQRALEMGMRIPGKTKMLITTRVNLSYSPDNVLVLRGLAGQEFKEYINTTRKKFDLPAIKDSKIDHLFEVTSGSPLFTESLLRLERRGFTIDQAIKQWRGEKGLEVRKAALEREIKHLSREAKRTLFVITHFKSASIVELTQIVEYTEQTLGDAIQELKGLFLVSAPSIGREARYTVDSNIGALVNEISTSLEIDHSALLDAIKRSGRDAIGLSLQKRSGIVGQAISQAIAFQQNGDHQAALMTVTEAARKIKPNADLLLAIGRFGLKIPSPDLEKASRSFHEAYDLGQRKPLLFTLWFETELARGNFAKSLEIAENAIDRDADEKYRWYERKAQVHIALATRSATRTSPETAIREIQLAIKSLTNAKTNCSNNIKKSNIDNLIKQAQSIKIELSNSNISKH